MKRYETVIIGAGHFSVGYAATHNGTLIIERTYLIDPCHGGALLGNSYSDKAIIHDKTRDLFNTYRGLGIAEGGLVDTPILEIGLASYAVNNGVSILFGTECIDIKEANGAYEVTIFGNAGFETLSAKRIIDNRRNDRKTVSVLLSGKRESCLNLASLSKIEDAFRGDEFVAVFDIYDGEDLGSAKARIMSLLSEISEFVKIVEFAPLASCRSQDYQDIFAAFEAGITLSEAMA